MPEDAFPLTSSQGLLFLPVVAGLTLSLMVGGCAVSTGRRQTSSLPATAPIPARPRVLQLGRASWYGPGFHGQPTASGEIYNQYDLTAAHPTLPLGSRAVVTNLDNGKSVEVRINDRGPFVNGRVIDLSHAAARSIGLTRPGTAPVRVTAVPHPSSSGIRHRPGRRRRNLAKKKGSESRERQVHSGGIPLAPEELGKGRNEGAIF